ncbi:type I polyketide synthase [Nonomuraea sp. NEAU-A123]|uniref:type I polyketide synthase n=1 Tax=Nonomuraea sp. NEAU-A123 TaxID=2839649 RepID=UPI001BE4423F|nr:type I polyketide synthase [Nonomuraea sp. NEAU-A123]MBT2230339.1 SDR family NAD(P)-dependent oxidoreductase [Nonomuraea sp. NEAU-A123]
MTDELAGEVSGNDIAIVGMSGRFPGASDVAGLWANIRDGRSGITRFTDDELRAAGVPEDLLADPGYVKAGAVIEGVELFDAGFFGFSPKEAQILDPQHRLFLEHSWEALEDAGCDPTRFDGAIGVFGGSGWSSYLQHNLMPNDIAATMGELALGLANDKDSLTLRVAHTLGLSGPSYAVQSYCSTSLVAVCAAASSLAGFECDLALAGGVAVNVPHRVGYLYQQGGIAPPDGECRAFDAGGLGSPLGSGVGVVALRRLEDALSAGDQIYAVIRGWAVNNDAGKKVGFTAPGVQGQAAVMAEALASAGLMPADIDYVEAHGTGTALGDAAELAALQQVFRDESCLIGSVKTNLGHLDRAAGVTSLIKTALALRHDEIPPTRNLTAPNPQLSAGEAELEVVTRLIAWPRRPGRTRRAGVSAFGIGGTNAHVVLEEAPPVSCPIPAPRPELLVWSARSAAAADAMTARLADHLASDSDTHHLPDIAYTLQSGRQVFGHRRMLVATTVDGAVAGLRDAGVLARADSRADRPVAFLIAGTGEQYPGLAADLYETEPVFRRTLDECRAVLRDHLDGVDPLAEMLLPRNPGQAAGLDRLLGRGSAPVDTMPTAVLQPALFAVEYALAQLVRSWGIEPALLAGYSLGEYVAACLAGVLPLDSALALVAHRARLIDALPAGAMSAVPLAADDLRNRLNRAGIADVDVAAVNGPELTVLAGPPAAMEAAREFLAGESVPCRPLATSHAFHSRMMEPVRDELTRWIATHVTLEEPRIPYVSNVTGALITAAEATDPGYWARHMCGPVLFDAVLGTLLEQGELALLEIGPGQSLGAMARGHRDCPRDRWPLVVSSLPAAADPRPASVVLAEGVGRLWLAGVPVDWAGYQQDRPVRKVGLPSYPFQRERYWIDPPRHQTAPAPDVLVAAPAPDKAVPHVQLMVPHWTATDGPAATGPSAGDAIGRCVVLADVGGVADAVVEALGSDGTEIVLVRPGGAFAEVVGGYTIDPESAADHTALARGLVGESPTTLVDLRLLDHPDGGDGRQVVLPLSRMLDAWGSEGGDSTRIIVATRGGQAVTAGEVPDPGQAAAATLPLVANQEYLNLDCRCVDLEAGTDVAATARDLVAELRSPATDTLAAYRAGRRHTRDYVPAAPDTTAPTEGLGVRPGGTYLMTGGLGDVGLLVAEHLVRAGAGRLILTSRGGVPATAGDPRYEAVQRLRALGAEVLTPQADVTDIDAMRAVMAEALRDGGRLDGVIHAAAETGRDTFLSMRDLGPEAVGRHFGAKVAGALVLRQVLAELPVERAPGFCVLFSSTSSLLGGITFGSYAAANAALTAVAHDTVASPTRWVAANWDTWSRTLEGMEGGIGAAMAAHAMSTEEGLAAFDRLVADSRPSLVVAAGGLDDRLPRAVAGPEPGAGGTRFPRPELPQPYSPPLTATERALAELWSEVLGIEPVGTRDNFFDLGGNSLVALQMLALVKKRFGTAVPTVMLFEAPTVHTLAGILDEKGAGAGRTAPMTARTTTSARATTVAKRVAQRAADGAVSSTDGTDADDDRRIAIVGMAGHFPGASDVGAFWNNLREGVESISFFSEEELLAAGVAPDLIHDPSYVPARPVLDDVSGFDAAFFGLSPRMAAITDPQQRAFIEVCWEALEQAGYAVPESRGRVGVFGGSNISTYLLRMGEHLLNDEEEVSHYEIIMGNDKDALTTTVSYLFDLYGPSVAVQTFCSTSLVAAHLAVQSLRNGECELALAGGVSIRVPDRIGHKFGPGGQESPDGHVRTFDARARGSMFGDGAAVVLLKRLSDAVRDGDHIWAVIRGSAMNNDGALKVGFTAPSVVGQARVIADAMADAGVTGEDISYIEAHGTATELGDPIELAALTRAFGETEETQYCPIGSVKTNIGHLDRAAGASGLIKTSLALREQVIPASLHYTSPNPEIDFENSPFYVNAQLSPWRTRDGRPRIAGINSLGMGGTNVHMVVEEAPVRPPAPPVSSESSRRYQVLPVSARNATAADQAGERLGRHLAAAPGIRLADVAFTLQVGRKTFEHRRVAVVDSVESAAAVLTGESPEPGVLSRVDTVQGRPVAFLLAGAGEQYPGLVTELYRREPEFRAALDECLELLRGPLGDVDLADLLAGGRGTAPDLAALLGRTSSNGSTKAGAGGDERVGVLERTEVVQPALFAVEYALARTLMTWGVQPRIMLGYSLGEYVAACLAGVLSLPDAIALVAYRAKLIDGVPPGSMAAVSLPAGELRRRFKLDERGLDLAAVNGPQVTVVAGPVEAMDGLLADLRRAEIPCRPLQTTHAFHSRMLARLSDELTAWVEANIELNPPALPYISNVTGEIADADLVCDPGYWARHMCGTVRFADGIDALLADPELAVVEIGPGQSLGALVRAAGCPPQRWPLILNALPGGSDSRPEDAVLAGCLARLWLLGADLDWAAHHGRHQNAAPADVLGAGLPGRIPLPTYPFQRQRYWIDPPASGARRQPVGALPALDLDNLFEAITNLPRLPEDQWMYLPVWRQTAPPAPGAQPGSWLVYTRDGLADQVAAELRRTAGAAVTLVRPGDAYADTADGYTVRPGSVGDTLSLLRDLRAAGRPLERVVHLWTLDAAPGDTTIRYGLHTLVALARAAAESGTDDWSLDVAVTGTQQVLGDDVSNPDGATLIGPCLVIPLEYPKVATRLIDLETAPPASATPGTLALAGRGAPALAGRGGSVVGGLVAELRRPQADRIVALRHGRRWVPGYETMAVDPDLETLRDGGVYLITGGLGGIALGLAERLARDCHANLVLLARRGLPPRSEWPRILASAGPNGAGPNGAGAVDEVTRWRIAQVTEIEKLGARVEIVTGDVSKPEDVRRAVDTAVERFGALHGVLHAAGVPGMGLMQFKRSDELDQVLAPKIAGTLAIAEALRIGEPDEVELDFLVLFASITSATGGGPGQVDYCAANAFLDGYAHRLAGTGRRVLAIDWGEWTWNAWEEGLAGYDGALQQFFRDNRARVGIDFEDGWRALLRALASGEPRVVVSTQDFPTVVLGSSRFNLEAVTSPAISSATGERHPRPELVTPYQEPSGSAEEQIAGIWCDSLKLDRVGVLDNFFELGGNSLLGVSIVAAMRRAFELDELPPHILYEAPTVSALGQTIEALSSGTGHASGNGADGGSHVRAQLRRSGLEASAARRRGR